MIKSRVSLAQVTSLGRSSVYVMYYVFGRASMHCVDYVRACCCAIAASMLGQQRAFCQGRGHLKAGGGRRE
jgi:hypothetical protein